MLNENLLVQNWNKRINCKEQKSPRVANVKGSHRAQWPPFVCVEESRPKAILTTGLGVLPSFCHISLPFKNQESILEKIFIV